MNAIKCRRQMGHFISVYECGLHMCRHCIIYSYVLYTQTVNVRINKKATGERGIYYTLYVLFMLKMRRFLL